MPGHRAPESAGLPGASPARGEAPEAPPRAPPSRDGAAGKAHGAQGEPTSSPWVSPALRGRVQVPRPVFPGPRW